MVKLIIKYQDDYIIEKNGHSYNLINIPEYAIKDAIANISIFIMLLCGKNLNDIYGSIRKTNYLEELVIIEKFFVPDFLKEIDEGIYLYDFDKLRQENIDIKEKKELGNAFLNLPLKLVKFSEIPENVPIEIYDDYIPIHHIPKYVVSDELKKVIVMLEQANNKRTDKDVLLMYSGGKDSTLSAIRLVKMGYNVYFIHFDNGHMLDSDKPYLTWKKAFFEKDGYYFPYKYSCVSIQKDFNLFFGKWMCEHNDERDKAKTSEIRCLSCRSAMYLKAIEIARSEEFKFIADGARISQKFMLEQIPMTIRYRNLAKTFGIEVLYPVLDLVDDNVEKQEIITAGFSSKTWESKCLLGEPAMDKTLADEKEILEYYDKIIKPYLERTLKKRRYYEEE